MVVTSVGVVCTSISGNYFKPFSTFDMFSVLQNNVQKKWAKPVRSGFSFLSLRGTLLM
jgi:hypothetical protein